MTQKLPKGALFDLDGVLIDTENQYSVFWGNIGREYNVGYNDFAERIKGTNLTSILNTYFPDKATQAEIVNRLNDFQDNMSYDLLPGVEEFIANLESNGITMCIVTSSDDKKMETLLTKQPFLTKHFTNIITGDDVTNSKPHPECFLKGANLLDCDITDCYVFEDSINGIKAGLASGAKVIALSTTVSPDVIKKYNHIVIPSFEGVTIQHLSTL